MDYDLYSVYDPELCLVFKVNVSVNTTRLVITVRSVPRVGMVTLWRARRTIVRNVRVLMTANALSYWTERSSVLTAKRDILVSWGRVVGVSHGQSP